MRNYEVNVYCQGSITVEVQADSPDEARAKAKQMFADGRWDLAAVEIDRHQGVEVEMA